MDENQIGPNTNTTPVQKCVRDSPYPGGYSSASVIEQSWVQIKCRQDQGHHGKFFVFLFFCFFSALILSPLLGIPKKAGLT